MNLTTNEVELERLVLDTLFERRLHRQGCFVDNEAAHELILCPPDVLPVIERIIRDNVEPAVVGGARIGGVFHGLTYVLGAYLLITAQSDPDRAVRYLSAMSEAMQIEVLGAIRTFFQWRDNSHSHGIAPPPQLRAFVKELAASQDESLRSAAESTLLRVVWEG
jgi:hypothetical protein